MFSKFRFSDHEKLHNENRALPVQIERNHPQIKIVDVPQHYDLGVFNRCAEDGCIMLSLDAWHTVHPSLVTIPFQVEETIPYGVLSSSKPSSATAQFLEIIKTQSRHSSAVPN